MEELIKYFNGNSLPAEVYKQKYAKIGEELPNKMLRRISNEFAECEFNRITKVILQDKFDVNKLSSKGKDYIEYIKTTINKETFKDFIFEFFKDFKYVVPGGSVLENLGSDEASSLSNCFVIDSPQDSYSSIMQSREYLTQLMKRRGGVGKDLSQLRPRGTIVKNAAKTSTGAASFMDVESALTNEIAQGGRRGALMLTLSIVHPDAEEFITKKQDLTKVTGANISIKITDEFMHCVLENKDFIQKFPINLDIEELDLSNIPYNELIKIDKGYIKKIKALDLWNKIIHCAWNTAEPGIIFEDAHFKYSPDGVYPEFKMISTNPCFHPDTLISTEYGLKKIKDITTPMRVYSMDSTGKLVMAQAHPSFISKKNVRTLKVTLRNGNSIQVTPEHKLYIHNKGWVEAKNIVLGDKIAHLCRSRRGAKYAGVHLTTSPNKQKDQVMEHKFVYGNYEFGYDIHHKDRNTYNNSIDNLELLSHSNHSKITSLKDNPQTHQVRNNLGRFISGLNSKRGKKTIIDLPKELSTNLKNSSYNNVIKIEDGDLTDVYDIYVNNTHCLIANNMVAHNCGEIGMQGFDSCRLMHHNLTSYVVNPFTKEAFFDYKTFEKNCYYTMVLGDVLVDLEIKAIENILMKIQSDSNSINNTEYDLWDKIRKTAKQSRRVGIGFTGLADVFAMLSIKYGSEESIELTKEIFYTKHLNELQSSIDMAILYNPFEGYNLDKEYLNDEPQNPFYSNLLWMFPEEVHRMKLNNGRRNLSWSTAAPTGSVSILTQTTSGIEPLFLPYYERKKKINNTEEKVTFIDKMGEKFTSFNVIHQPFKQWLLLSGFTENEVNDFSLEELDNLFKKSPWYGSTANELNYKERILMQSVIQKYTTHSISSTINLPKETKDSVIDNIYREGYKADLKGLTVYRDGCRDGILTSVNSNASVQSLKETTAPKRPKELPAHLHIVSIKGVKFAIIVGLYENKPYEVFAFELVDPKTTTCDGKIVKISKRVYNFVSDKYTISNLELSHNNNVEKKAFTLYTSMSLRHGVPIKYIVKILSKVDENITSFAKALTRVLNQYVPKEILANSCPECNNFLIRENGCVHCSQCSYSEC